MDDSKPLKLVTLKKFVLQYLQTSPNETHEGNLPEYERCYLESERVGPDKLIRKCPRHQKCEGYRMPFKDPMHAE